MIKIRDIAIINNMIVCLESTENGIIVSTTTKCYKLINNNLVPIDTKPDDIVIEELERANKDQRLKEPYFRLSKKVERYNIKVKA
mgnify:CR=1 FL=1